MEFISHTTCVHCVLSSRVLSGGLEVSMAFFYTITDAHRCAKTFRQGYRAAPARRRASMRTFRKVARGAPARVRVLIRHYFDEQCVLMPLRLYLLYPVLRCGAKCEATAAFFVVQISTINCSSDPDLAIARRLVLFENTQ